MNTWRQTARALLDKLAVGLVAALKPVLVEVPKWVSRHFPNITRAVAAAALFVWIALPVAQNGTAKLFNCPAKNVSADTVTSTALAVALMVSGVEQYKPTPADDDKRKNPEKSQISNEACADPQVLVCVMQAISLLGVLGISVWAIVSLLRHD